MLVAHWIERVPTLTLDGARPTQRELAVRMGEFWLPDETVVYIGMTNQSIGGRVGAFVKTPLGDRRPHSGGHWLKTLTVLPELRVWWAPTTAPEEYEDALLTAFAQGVSPEAKAALRDSSVVAAVGQPPVAADERKQHGIKGSLLVDEADGPVSKAERVAAAAAAARGDGRWQAGAADPTRRTGVLRSSTARPRSTTPRAATGSRAAAAAIKAAGRPAGTAVQLSPEGLIALRAELDELINVQRPAIVARIAAARELGDLKENSDYHEARREQSFAEGRVRMLEDQLRNAVVVEGTGGSVVADGSTVVVERMDPAGALETTTLQDRRRGRGQPPGRQDLERLADRCGADRAQARRRGRGRHPLGADRVPDPRGSLRAWGSGSSIRATCTSTARSSASARRLPSGRQRPARRHPAQLGADRQPGPRLRVDAVLVAGDVFEGANRTLRAQVAFRDGLERLAQDGSRRSSSPATMIPLSGWEPAVTWPELAWRIRGRRHRQPADHARRDRASPGSTASATPSGTSPATWRPRSGATATSRTRSACCTPTSAGIEGYGNYAPCSLSDLASSGMDYWALGHIHKHGVLRAADPTVVYCGNPQGRDPGESDPRGCYLVDVDDRGRADARVPADGRRALAAPAVPIEGIPTEEALFQAVGDGIETRRDRRRTLDRRPRDPDRPRAGPRHAPPARRTARPPRPGPRALRRRRAIRLARDLIRDETRPSIDLAARRESRRPPR